MAALFIILIIIAAIIYAAASISTQRKAVKLDEERRLELANVNLNITQANYIEEEAGKTVNRAQAREEKVIDRFKEITRIATKQGNISSVIIRPPEKAVEMEGIRLLTAYKAVDNVRISLERYNEVVSRVHELERRPFRIGPTWGMEPVDFILFDFTNLKQGAIGKTQELEDKPSDSIVEETDKVETDKA